MMGFVGDSLRQVGGQRRSAFSRRCTNAEVFVATIRRAPCRSRRGVRINVARREKSTEFVAADANRPASGADTMVGHFATFNQLVDARRTHLETQGNLTRRQSR